MKRKVKILIVDDHKIIREAVKYHLNMDERFEVVSEASDGFEALEILENHTIDLVILDLNMAGMNGIATSKVIKLKYPETHILVLTMVVENQYIKEMIKAGAAGYILKTSGMSEIVEGILEIMNGSKFFSKDVMNIVIGNMQHKPAKKVSKFDLEVHLSEREKEVLRLVVKEYSNQQIADALYISVRTVESHKRNLLEKTGSKNTAGLVIFAMEHGIISTDNLH